MELSDLIPLWCEGIDKRFWQTDAGKRAARIMYDEHYNEAITLSSAARIAYGTDRPSNAQVITIYKHLDAYVIPTAERRRFRRYGKRGFDATHYFRRSDATKFHDKQLLALRSS